MDSRRAALAPALRRLEAESARDGMPLGAKHRIAARLHEEAERRSIAAAPRRWLPAITFAAGAALVMLVVGSGVRPPTATYAALDPTPAPRHLGAFAVEGEDCREMSEGAHTVLRGSCRLVSDAMVVETWDRARLGSGPTGLVVVEGTASFHVGKVPPGAPPVRVQVSHGAIEVLGTRFTVQQGGEGGHVDLFEGRIRFVNDDVETDVRPGQRLGWGNEAEPVRVAAPAEPQIAATPQEVDIEIDAEPASVDAKPRSRGADAEAIIERVSALRARGRHRAAADVLRRALRRSWDSRTAEVLSYELGRILERQLHDTTGACAHWLDHAERFASGRYADAVARSLRRCAG